MPQMVFDDPDGTLAMLRDSVAGLAARHPGAATLRRKRASGGDLDRDVWSAMAEAGWTGILVPEGLGGAGLGLAEQAVISEALGRELITEPLSIAAVMSGILLRNAPASAERDRLLAGIVSGEAVVVPAWTDPANHSRATKLTAKKDDDGYILSGEKHFVDAAASATDFLVVADTGSGAVLLSLPNGAKGLGMRTHAGVDGTAIFDLTFEGCRVGAGNVLASAGSADELLDEATLHARIAIAAELAGIAAKAVEMTVAYTKDRVQFGKPIASFQVIQHRLVDMWSDAEFACAAVVNAASRYAEGDRKAAHLAVLAAKARAGDAAVANCRRGVHLHGAMGFTDEGDIGLYLKRALNLNATLGQPEGLRREFVELERAA